MKIRIIILLHIMMLGSIYETQSQNREHEKIQLQELVQERETRFGEYSRAAASRSGIFGNKTKKDLKDQVEILTEIIRTDNKIISRLNSFLDYRSFQRTEQTYTQAELDEKNKRLSEVSDNLLKKINIIEAENKDVRFKLKWARLWNFLLLGVVIYLGFLFVREKRRRRDGSLN